MEEIKRLIPGEEYRKSRKGACSDVFCKDVDYTHRSVYYYHSGYDSPLLKRVGNNEYIVRDVIHVGNLRANVYSKERFGREDVDEFAVFLVFTIADADSGHVSYFYKIPEDYGLYKTGIIHESKYDRDEIEWGFEDAHIVERIVGRPILTYMLYASLSWKVEVRHKSLWIARSWKEVHEYIVIDSGAVDRDVIEKWTEYDVTTSQLLRDVYGKVYGEECGSGRKVVYPDDSGVFCHLPLPYILRRVVLELDKYGRDIALVYALMYSLPFVSNVTSKPRNAVSNYLLYGGDPIYLHFDDGTTLELRRFAVAQSPLRDPDLTARAASVLEHMLTVVIPVFDVNYAGDCWC